MSESIHSSAMRNARHGALETLHSALNLLATRRFGIVADAAVELCATPRLAETLHREANL